MPCARPKHASTPTAAGRFRPSPSPGIGGSVGGMRIAVVGASGNVGTALLRRLHAAQSERADDLEIVGIARRVPDATQAPYDGVTWVALDVAAGDARQRLAEAFKGCDAVVHLAWVLQPNHDEEKM